MDRSEGAFRSGRSSRKMAIEIIPKKEKSLGVHCLGEGFFSNRLGGSFNLFKIEILNWDEELFEIG